MKNFKKGFTLIELLVVISIIGLLASVVMVSVSSARNKAKDSRIISDVLEMRRLAEAKRSIDGNYMPVIVRNLGGPVAADHGSGLSTIDSDVAKLKDDVAGQGSKVYASTIHIIAPPFVSGFAIYGILVSDPAKSFCADSAGKTSLPAANSTNTTCP